MGYCSVTLLGLDLTFMGSFSRVKGRTVHHALPLFAAAGLAPVYPTPVAHASTALYGWPIIQYTVQSNRVSRTNICFSLVNATETIIKCLSIGIALYSS